MNEEKRLELAIELAKLEVLGQIRDAVTAMGDRKFVIHPASTDTRVRRAMARLDELMLPEPPAADSDRE